MSGVMEGVTILEVAEQTFVPAASALLSDWGAKVIKIEHAQRGDAMRGLASTGVALIPNNIHALFEHSNRGKLSLGLDLASDEGIEILYQLAAQADVFLCNKLAGVRRKLRIDVEDIRAHNPDIIYVRGTGQGERGPDADKGSYDALSFWNRSGVALGVKRPEEEVVPLPPGPGFGDSIGAVTLVSGISAALFHRAKTGEAKVVDVSLLASGMWAQGQGIALASVLGFGFGSPAGGITPNPLARNYKTSDGRYVALICLQAGKYWPHLVELLGKPELATDERFATHEALMANNLEAGDILTAEFAARPVAEWRDVLEPFIGQWTIVQDTFEVISDPQTVANDYMQELVNAEGKDFKLVSSPVQFDGEAPGTSRAPDFNEHGDAILADLGIDWDTVVELKIKGVVA